MSENIDYKKTYDDFLSNMVVPPMKIEISTIFDISGYPHYENVISNWYAFFLDPEGQHGLRDLFYTSLRNVLQQKTDGADTLIIEREYTTKKNGRIDLVIAEGCQGEGFDRPIIIENKVYHNLDSNDLLDYRDSIKSTSDDKTCVVLCLHESDGENTNGFDIVTHKQYLDTVKNNLADYIIQADPRCLILLQDLFRNVERLTRVKTMDESAKYYFSNHEKIDNLLEIRGKANLDIINALYKQVGQRKGWKWRNSKAIDGKLSFSICDQALTVYVTLEGVLFKIEAWMSDKLKDTVDHINSEKLTQLMTDCFKSGDALEPESKRVLTCRTYAVDLKDLENYHEYIFNIVSVEYERLITEILENRQE